MGVCVTHQSLDRCNHSCIVAGELRSEWTELDSEAESLHGSHGSQDMRAWVALDEGFDRELGTQHADSVCVRSQDRSLRPMGSAVSANP